MLVAAAIALVATAVFVATGAASTQDIGGYQVTDTVTQDTAAGTTTVTYQIFRPAGAKGLGQVNVGIDGCHTSGDIIAISHSGSIVTGTDPSTKQAGPLIRWTSDLGAKSGETVYESYTVQGLFDPSTGNQLGIKSGSDFTTGPVQGVGCTPTSTGGGTTNTGGGTNTVGGNTVAGSQGVAGVSIALPASSKKCLDTRKFKFRLHHASTQPVTDVVVFINNKRKLHKHGTSINAVTIKKLPHGNFTVRVVATQASGSTLTSVRKYKGCKKSKPKTTGHHVNSH